MIKCLVITILLSIYGGVARAEDDQRFLLLGLLAAADYHQSCEMFYKREGIIEINPILGEKPGRRDMALFGLVSLALVWLLDKEINDPLRTVLMDSIIASESMNVQENSFILNSSYHRKLDAIPIMITFRWD